MELQNILVRGRWLVVRVADFHFVGQYDIAYGTWYRKSHGTWYDKPYGTYEVL